MLGIVLQILKIIGIILLILLALILLVILIVLLIPLRYTLQGQKEEDSGPQGNVLVTWLLRIFKVEIDIGSQGINYSVRAAGFKLAGNKPEKKEDEAAKAEAESEPAGSKDKEAEPDQDDADAAAKSEAESEPAGSKDKEAEPDQDDADVAPKSEAEPDPAGSIDKEAEPDQDDEDAAAKGESSQEKPAVREDKDRPAEKTTRSKRVAPLLELIDGLLQKIENAEDFLDEKSGQVQDWKGKADDLHLDVCLPFSLDLLKRILIHILPRKMEGDLDYGFDDGYRMGQVIGFAATFYPIYGKHLRVTPHFEKKILTGHLQGKGRIRIGFLVWQIIRTLLNKDMRRLIVKIVKKEL